MTSTCVTDPVLALFPEARTLGTAGWSVARQNGHDHLTSVTIRDGLIILNTPLADLRHTPSQLALINASLPAGCRILCSRNGIHFAAELAKDGGFPSVLNRAVSLFQRGLDLVSSGGALILDPPAEAGFLSERLDADPSWQLTEDADGLMTGKLPHKKDALPVTVSARGIDVQVLGPGNYAPVVRDAVAELLLRSASGVKFVRASAEEHPGGQWAARLNVPPHICSVDDALTALAIVIRDCGAEAGLLADPAVAQLYCEISSLWRSPVPPIFNEGR